MLTKSCRYTAVSAVFLLLAALPLMAADESKVRINVKPPQASIFVDGVSFGDSSKTIKVAPGKHTIAVYNYGYTSQSRDVTLDAGKNAAMDFNLVAVQGQTSGPWGRIQIEGAPRAAVLMNGKTPDFLVGHADEFDNSGDWFNCCTQQLVVPAGTHQLTLKEKDKEIWSGPVTVGVNQRVIIHVPSGKTKVKPWPEGATYGSLDRFKAGVASASVAVAPVTGTLSASNGQLNCGDSTQLSWQTSEAVQRTLSAQSESPQDVAATGQQSVSPKANTTYNLVAAGPGGVVNQSATVNVNNQIQSSLQASPAEVHYRQIGDKVLQQDTANLTWDVSNANSVSIDPLGTVSPKDSQTVKIAPPAGTNGAVDQTQTYTLTAKNDCGGTSTQTASVRMVGSVEPIPEVSLSSVFFPTGFPDKRHPEAGLVKSQQDALAQTAAGFKKYLEYDPDAKLTVIGNADVRDSNAKNLPLSQRRADRVKAELVADGVPESKIEVVAQGDEHPLDPNTVKDLHEQNPKKAPESLGNFQDLVWAYNRRVDLVLEPKDIKSTQYYPADAEDAPLLARSNWPDQKDIVVLAAEKERLPADSK